MQHPPSASEHSDWTEEVGRRAPNILTGLRFFAVPFFVWLLIDPTPASKLWATLLFLVASLTDWLDGYLARIYKAESILGKMLDPLADKILVMAALVMLAAVMTTPRVPAWMVVVLLSREMIISGLRSIAALSGVVVAASDIAKHKTAWTMLAIMFLVVDEPYVVFGVPVDFHLTGMVFLWFALILSVGSGIGYAVSLRKVFL